MTGPVLIHQTYVFEFTRPKRMGWPTLVQDPIPGWRTPSRIEPHKIRVTVRHSAGCEPEVSRISVTGKWCTTGRAVVGQTLKHRHGQQSAIGVTAPDWVLELAAEALAETKRESACEPS
jgi:hypothetical protein